MVGCSEVISLLLDAGASLSLSDGYSLTPLDSAVVHDRPDICRLLISHRADPNELNADGCTALQVRLSSPVTTQAAKVTQHHKIYVHAVSQKRANFETE